jgi:hypothetical protein
MERVGRMLQALGGVIDLDVRAAETQLQELAAASVGYAERLAGLRGVPAENLQRLQRRLEQLRRRLELD